MVLEERNVPFYIDFQIFSNNSTATTKITSTIRWAITTSIAVAAAAAATMPLEIMGIR